jgi:hypothetical protein
VLAATVQMSRNWPIHSESDSKIDSAGVAAPDHDQPRRSLRGRYGIEVTQSRTLWVANSRSNGNRGLKQTAAMLVPRVVIKCGRSRCGCAGALRRRRAIERAVDPIRVVVILEFEACVPGPQHSKRIPDQDTRAGSFRSAVRQTDARPGHMAPT